MCVPYVQQVELTDVEAPVLRNLRNCVQLNSSATDIPSEAFRQQEEQRQPLPTDADLFDDADSVDEGLDLGALMTPNAHTGGSSCSGAAATLDYVGQCCSGQDGVEAATAATGPLGWSAWEADNMHVRLLDWLESLQWLRQQQRQQHQLEDGSKVPRAGTLQCTQQKLRQHARGQGIPSDVETIDPQEFYAKDILRTEYTGPLLGKACSWVWATRCCHTWMASPR